MIENVTNTGDDYSRFGITHLFDGRVFVYDWQGHVEQR